MKLDLDKSKVKFSQHALQQLQMRLVIDPIEAILKGRELFECSCEVDGESAKQIINEHIVDKYNDNNTAYFVINLPKGNGIFIVRENIIVTFKTDFELELFDVLGNYEKSRRMNKPKKTKLNEY